MSGSLDDETPVEPASDDEAGLVRMSDEEERLAARVAEDLGRVLGIGIAVSDLEIIGDRPVRVRAALMAEGAIREVEGVGDTTADACRELIRAAAALRLERTFWRTVGDV